MQQPWQQRALSYYDQIGEIRFASQFYAKLLSRVRFYPARQLDDGTTEPISEGPPVDILHRIHDPGGGRSRLQYDYGRMMFVTGEGVLFGQENALPTSAGASCDELKSGRQDAPASPLRAPSSRSR
jgi:hypothetical protein